MNFLAHLYLSGPEPDVLLGNFLGDFVKGRDWQRQLGPAVARGVQLHRAIDAFTDRHPIVKQSQARLRPKYRHYATVIVDIYYDHYLAARWGDYSPEPLPAFVARAYEVLAAQEAQFPARARWVLPRMRQGNWLVNYAHLDGIHRAFGGMAHRARPGSQLDEATHELVRHYADFETEFRQFFPELQAFASAWLQSQGPLGIQRRSENGEGGDVHAFVHEAEVEFGANADPRAVGAAVTVALCGHWDHPGPCRWPHNNHIEGTRFRTLFVATDDEEPDVRRRIQQALHTSSDWRVIADRSSEVAAEERVLAATLLEAPRAPGP